MADRGPERLWTPAFVQVTATNFALFSSMHMLFSTIPLFALHLGGTKVDAGLAALVFSAASTLVRLRLGAALDEIGRYPILVVSLAVVMAVGFGHIWIAAVTSLLVARAIHGLAWGASVTSNAAVMVDLLPARRRGEGVGFYSLSVNLAAATMPALGLLLVEWVSYTALFLVSGTLALLALALGAALRGPSGARAQVARSGGALFPAGTLAPSVATVATTFSMGVAITFVALHVIEQQVGSPAVFFTGYALLVVLTRPLLGRFSDRRGRAAAILPGQLGICLGVLGLSVAGSLPALLAATVLFGLGWSAATGNLQAAMLDVVPPERQGAAVNAYQLSFDTGVGIGGLVGGVVAEALGTSAAFQISALVTGAGLLLTWLSRVGGRSR